MVICSRPVHVDALINERAFFTSVLRALLHLHHYVLFFRRHNWILTAHSEDTPHKIHQRVPRRQQLVDPPVERRERACAELEVDVALARRRVSGGALTKAWSENSTETNIPNISVGV